MLEENKKLYIQCADLIPEWKKLSKNDLANLYLEETNENKKNSYFSALVCKFWNLVNNFYYKQGIKVANETDCHDWVIDGILKALDEKVWKDSNNVLFNDPKGPEKAITVCIYSIRANFYQYAGYDKRSLNYSSLSLEDIQENASDGFFIPYFDQQNIIEDYIVKLVNEEFKKKDYFLCFFYDLVFNLDIVIQDQETNEDIISFTKFIKFINRVDELYLNDFSSRYQIEKEKVQKAFQYVRCMPKYKMQYNVSRALNNLKKNKTLYDILRSSSC